MVRLGQVNTNVMTVNNFKAYFDAIFSVQELGSSLINYRCVKLYCQRYLNIEKMPAENVLRNL